MIPHADVNKNDPQINRSLMLARCRAYDAYDG
jgi:hypothetical protein